MRIQPFFNYLSNHLSFDLAKNQYFSTSPHFHGGWEVWLQCEIAAALKKDNVPFSLEREKPYSGRGNGNGKLMAYSDRSRTASWTNTANSAARADFFVQTANGRDPTHFELKCIYGHSGPQDGWRRFGNDIAKIEALNKLDPNLNAIAMLGTYGIFKQEDMADVFNIVGQNTSYVIDFGQAPPKVSTLKNVAQGGQDRFFLVGYGVIA